MIAYVHWLRQAVFKRYFRFMFGMTGRALQRIDVFQQLSVTRVLEFFCRMRIKRFNAVLTMTINASLLQHLATTK